MLNIGAKKRDQIVIIVLGARTTNAIHLERDGTGFNFLNYTLQPTPAKVPGLSHELMVEHFKRVYQALEAQTRRVIVVIGMGDSILRHAELPILPLPELRGLIQNNSKNLLQQDLSDYIVDCHVLSTPVEPRTSEGGRSTPKCKVLIGGARKQIVQDLQAAMSSAGLIPEHITLSQVGLVNAAWIALPDIVRNGVVALVDIGFASSTISFLIRGEVMLSRVVAIGAQAFTHGLAEAMSISHQAAEGAILVMTDKVRAQLLGLLTPLHQELRASIDFFEDEHNQRIERVFVSGGSARSDFIIEALATGLALPVGKWDPTTTLNLKLPPQRMDEVAKDAPQLAVAIGAAMAWFDQHLIHIDFLATRHEAEARRRRDPVRWGLRLAALITVAMLTWAGILGYQIWRAEIALGNSEKALHTVQKRAIKVAMLSKQIGELERTLRLLTKHATNRFLWAVPLGELPAAMVENLQMIQVKMEEGLTLTPGTKESRAGDKVIPAKPATVTQKFTLTLQAKDSGDPAVTEEFIKTLTELEWFKANLTQNRAVRLKDRGPEQVDPTDPSRTFILITVECAFPEKVTRDE